MSFFVSHKKIFLFLFVILGSVLFTKQLVSKKNFSYKKEESFHQRDQKLKSPCRGLMSERNKQKNASEPQRADQLNQLMDIPIDWVFKDVKGEVFDLYCYRGRKKVLLNLWATWCPPCIEELPSLSALAERAKEDLFVVAVTTEPLETALLFIERSFPHLSAELKIVKTTSEELLQYFPPDSLPVTYLFSKNGKLENKFIGAKDWLNMGLFHFIKPP